MWPYEMAKEPSAATVPMPWRITFRNQVRRQFTRVRTSTVTIRAIGRTPAPIRGPRAGVHPGGYVAAGSQVWRTSAAIELTEPKVNPSRLTMVPLERGGMAGGPG
jgi:hypothetical protein